MKKTIDNVSLKAEKKVWLNCLGKVDAEGGFQSSTDCCRHTAILVETLDRSEDPGRQESF